MPGIAAETPWLNFSLLKTPSLAVTGDPVSTRFPQLRHGPDQLHLDLFYKGRL